MEAGELGSRFFDASYISENLLRSCVHECILFTCGKSRGRAITAATSINFFLDDLGVKAEGRASLCLSSIPDSSRRNSLILAATFFCEANLSFTSVHRVLSPSSDLRVVAFHIWLSKPRNAWSAKGFKHVSIDPFPLLLFVFND